MAGKKGTDQYTKNMRLREISRIITEYEISTQEELCDKLKERGYEVTQATLSRDIRTLMLTKVNKGTHSVYRLPITTQDKSLTKTFESMTRDLTLSVAQAENQVVVRTRAGMANAMAAIIDQLKIENVMGTIAGDDTILVITKDKNSAAYFCKLMEKMK